jgi:hypothetical protein
MGANGTYDEALPTDRDKVRMVLADTDSENFLVSDAHIDAVLTWKGSLSGAVIALAGELIAEFARQPVRTGSGGESVDYGDRLKSWQLIIEQAKEDGAAASGSNTITFVPTTYGEDSDNEWGRPYCWWRS